VISIKVDMKPVQEMIAKAGREMPFAIAKGLTKTAQDVQSKVIEGLPNRFTLRTGWYKPNTPYGFKIEKATKQNMTAKVFTSAPFMQMQEEGGTKRLPSGKRIAVPFLEQQGRRPGVVYGVKRTKRDLIMKSQKPRNLAKAFTLKGRHGDLLAMRQGRGKRSVLRIMYALEQVAQIKKRLGFAETARMVINAVWRRNLEEAIDYALKTSRAR
jgi:hypothetical protein